MGIGIIINDPIAKYANTVAYAASATYAIYANTADYAGFVFHAAEADYAPEADTATIAGEIPDHSCCWDTEVDPVEPPPVDPTIIVDPAITPPPVSYTYDAYYQIVDSCIPTLTGGLSALVSYSVGSCITNYLNLTPEGAITSTWTHQKAPSYTTTVQGTSDITTALAFARLECHVNFSSSDSNVGSYASTCYRHSLSSDSPWTIGSIYYVPPSDRYYIYTQGKFSTQQLYGTPSPAWAGISGNMIAGATTTALGNCFTPPGAIIVINGDSRYLLSLLTLATGSYAENYSSYMYPQTTWTMGAGVQMSISFPRDYNIMAEEDRRRIFDRIIADDITELNLRKDIREISCNKKYIKADGHDYCRIYIQTSKKEIIWLLNDKFIISQTKNGVSELILTGTDRTKIMVNIMSEDVIYNPLEVNFV